MQNPISEELKAELETRRARGEKIVFTNGCFDILHVGHTRYLSAARELGGLLVIGLNSDASVRRLKGPERPVNGELARMEVLLSLRSVDHVVVFEQDTPLELIKAVRPHILVKGGDWGLDQIVGSDFVQANGGTVLTIPFVDGFSTTSIIQRAGGAAPISKSTDGISVGAQK
jgi:rfaE bifunctional protein nucleotidyltransferase chain/domain